jgi:hypothetical protein
MKKFLSLAVLAVFMVCAPSCSKEKRLERMLYKSDGSWNITTMNYTYISTDENNVSVTVSATAENAGTFRFEEDGDGSYNFTVGGVTHAQSFGWSTSEESFVITKIKQDINFVTFDIEQLVIALSGEKSDRNQITLSGSETIQTTSDTNISQAVLTVNMTLDKN